MATATTTINVTTQKADNVLELQALIHGINTLLPTIDPFMLARRAIPRAELLARVQARLAAARAAGPAPVSATPAAAPAPSPDAGPGHVSAPSAPSAAPNS